MPSERSVFGLWLLAALALPALGTASSHFRGSGSTADRLDALEQDNRRLQHQLAHLHAQNAALSELAGYLSVDTARDTITITGANLYLQSGSGATDDHGALRGRGNLIVGYAAGEGALERSGSHNIILGDGHTWSSYGSVVLGRGHIAAGPHALVAGSDNVISGSYDVVSGSGNIVSGGYAVVTGGARNTASGDFAAVSGSYHSTAAGSYTTVVGGAGAVLQEPFSAVQGQMLR